MLRSSWELSFTACQLFSPPKGDVLGKFLLMGVVKAQEGGLSCPVWFESCCWAGPGARECPQASNSEAAPANPAPR